MAFDVRWSWTLWESLGFDINRESIYVASQARLYLVQLPPVDPALLVLTDAALETGDLPQVPQILPAPVRYFFRLLFAAFGYMAWGFVAVILFGLPRLACAQPEPESDTTDDADGWTMPERCPEAELHSDSDLDVARSRSPSLSRRNRRSSTPPPR